MTRPSCRNQLKRRGFQSREIRAGARATRHVPARLKGSSWALCSRKATGGPPSGRSQAGQSERKKEAARANTAFPGASPQARSTVHAASNSPRTRGVGTARARKGRANAGLGDWRGACPVRTGCPLAAPLDAGWPGCDCGVCGPRTMFSLLGVTTLLLAAGVPRLVRSAAGERRGVPAQAPGRRVRLGGAMLEAAVRGGGWVVLDVLLGGLWSSLAAVLRLKPTWTRISNRRKWGSRSYHAACLARSVSVTGLGAPSPRVLQPSAAGWSLTPAARNVREPLWRVCFFGQLGWTA